VRIGGTLRIRDVVWLPDIVDKLTWKHNIVPQEVEEVFVGRPQYRLIERGKIRGEVANVDSGTRISRNRDVHP